MVLISFKNTHLFLFAIGFFVLTNCVGQKKAHYNKVEDENIIVGANRTDKYIPLLKGKKVALVGNQTSVIFKGERNVHLADSLLNRGLNIVKVFSPEHGFRGKADAGEVVKNGVDTKTGLPIISLYGKNKKPTEEQFSNIDVVLFDIQDVGVRFYTYISTLHYVMERCAEMHIPIIVLDRPNPNAHYIDGAVLNPKYKSFVGMHPVPVVYGMTIGEYAQMINGEKWLKNGVQANLTVIPLQHYNHQKKYDLPIKPSPNLPNSKSINLYPSLCFFEGTNVSCGRGTDLQFQIYGSPYLEKTDFSFTPQPNAGAKFPKHKNKKCYGENLTKTPYLNKLNLSWLINAYQQTSKVKVKFWNNFFYKLAGNKDLQKQIEQGVSEEEIRKSWEKGLEEFKKVREKYLLY
ncbi:MAG: DUF1343 domain-containing protein [Flavobacteriaceae bacterium]|nr:DUF1343 domain-containing protein [Flavobacteriaceae bacterium]